jgi:CHAD domain-containing protein
MTRLDRLLASIDPDDDIRRVAPRIVRIRLRNVWRGVRRLTASRPCSAKCIHALRVATRRADAAIDVFRSVLRRRDVRWLSKRIKRIRRAAGAVRNCDILLTTFAHNQDQSQGDPPRHGHQDAAIRLVHAMRRESERRLICVCRRFKRDHFRSRVRLLAARSDQPDDMVPVSLNTLGKDAVGVQIGQFLNVAGLDSSDLATLHQVRIEAKKLRYTLENFSILFDSNPYESAMQYLEDIHRRLGDLNDRRTNIELLKMLLRVAKSNKLRAKIQDHIEAETERLEACHHNFREGWTSRPLAVATARLTALVPSSSRQAEDAPRS